MSYSETDWTIPGVRSSCCDAPVLNNDICTKCHDHCGTRVTGLVCQCCGKPAAPLTRHPDGWPMDICAECLDHCSVVRVEKSR